MPPPKKLICRKCKESSKDPGDVKDGWCPSCKLFQYEIYNPSGPPGEHIAPPVRLDTIIGDLQRSRRRYGRERSSLLLEQYDTADGVVAWRACLMVSGRAVEHSRRAQFSPQDALRELDLLCSGTNPEDI
jgi:hypothetical protein